MSYAIVGKFLSDLKKEFSRGDDKIIKVVELKKVKQKSKTIKEFVQEFKRVVKSSGYYKERLLVEEFKRGISKMIRQKLIELECLQKY